MNDLLYYIDDVNSYLLVEEFSFFAKASNVHFRSYLFLSNLTHHLAHDFPRIKIGEGIVVSLSLTVTVDLRICPDLDVGAGKEKKVIGGETDTLTKRKEEERGRGGGEELLLPPSGGG